MVELFNSLPIVISVFKLQTFLWPDEQNWKQTYPSGKILSQIPAYKNMANQLLHTLLFACYCVLQVWPSHIIGCYSYCVQHAGVCLYYKHDLSGVVTWMVSWKKSLNMVDMHVPLVSLTETIQNLYWFASRPVGNKRCNGSAKHSMTQLVFVRHKRKR